MTKPSNDFSIGTQSESLTHDLDHVFAANRCGNRAAAIAGSNRAPRLRKIGVGPDPQQSIRIIGLLFISVAESDLTLQIGLVLAILVVSLVLFVSEKLRMDLIALMVLGMLV